MNAISTQFPELPAPAAVLERTWRATWFVGESKLDHGIEQHAVYTADQMHQYARDYAAMLAAAPAASGGDEPDPLVIAKELATSIWSAHYREDSPNWEPFDNLAYVLSQISNMVSGMTRIIEPPSAASVGGVHPDALQDGTLSKSTAKRVETLAASGGKRTIQQRGLADPNPYKASESPLLTNPEWGVQLNSPASASVSERARELLATEYDKIGLNVAATHIRSGQHGELDKAIISVIEQALTQPSEAERERDLLAEAIGNAGIKCGLLRKDIEGLTGPQLLMVCDDMAQALTQQRWAEDGRSTSYSREALEIQGARWRALCRTIDHLSPGWDSGIVGAVDAAGAAVRVLTTQATTPQPSADAVRELVAEWKVRPGVTDAYKICADELESLLSGGSHA